ncbi:flagellar assembly protein A [Nautilia sp. PV-1]|uniref:flagellar assembly protein A n=1 Tax=Nautilia sp. PV-1 TaxID=2579250 RepID=UPI001FEF96DE|nr:flagellar assembly protein A [Nautilia sp. PV-1]
MRLGIFDFLKKEEKAVKKEVLPYVVRTENVNEALLKISASNNIPLSSLDFDILDFTTYIKIGSNSEFVELDDQSRELVHMEDFLINEENEIKQVYEIEIKRAEFSDDFELIGEVKINRFMTHAVYIVKPESLLIYKPDLQERLKTELNKKKIKNSMLIELFDDKMNQDIEKVVAKIRVLGQLEQEEEIELCQGIDPVENIEGKVIYHYLKKKESIKNELIFPVKTGDVLIEIIKPMQGRNGRDCRGKIIKIPEVREFEIPNITFNPEEIKKEEDDKKILYIALKDGYIYKDGDSYTIKDEMEIAQINLQTGNVSGAKDSNVKLDVKESDALKEAIADNMTVETTILIVRGNVGKAAKINAKELTIEGQTHQKAKIYADKAFINIHKGYVEGKEIEINRLESGIVKGKKVKIKQAIGGKIVAEEVEFEIMGSHVEVYALKQIKINKLKGSENRLIISPLEVLGLNADADKLEKMIEEVKRNLEIKTKEYNKRKEVLLKNKPTIEKYMKTYKENKAKGVKTSAVILKKIKEYNEFKDKTLELKNEILLLQKDLQELHETLQNYQTAIFNAKIISCSPWSAFNRIEFDMVEPPVKLRYDTKGSEGVCGFKLKDYGDTYKIVKIKVDDNDCGS